MTTAPPQFAERSSCSGCNTGFTFLTRRHHCRNCGESFCAACTPYSDPLPHFGFNSPERTCAKCHEYLKSGARGASSSKSGLGSLDDAFSSRTASSRREQKADDGDDDDDTQAAAAARRANCTCGMPLCVCAKQQPSKSNLQANISKSTTTSRAAATTTSSTPAPNPTPARAFMGFPSMSSGPAATIDPTKDVNDQCREAIKNGQVELVRQLIAAKASMTYVDRSGNTLLHMACIMDKMPIITMLIDAGANPYVVNTQSSANETPYDVASPSVQFRLKQLVPPPETHE